MANTKVRFYYEGSETPDQVELHRVEGDQVEGETDYAVTDNGGGEYQITVPQALIGIYRARIKNSTPTVFATRFVLIENDNSDTFFAGDTYPDAVISNVWQDLNSLRSAVNTLAIGLAQANGAINALQQQINNQAGGGVNEVVLTIDDGSSALQGVFVRMKKDISNDYVLQTDQNGQATFNLEAGTYVLSMAFGGYTFAAESVVVNGDLTLTKSMTQTAVSASDPDKVTGQITVYSALGVVENNVSVTMFPLTVNDESTGLAIIKSNRTSATDSNGVAQFTNLIRGVTYAYYVSDGNRVRRHKIPENAESPYTLPSIVS